MVGPQGRATAARTNPGETRKLTSSNFVDAEEINIFDLISILNIELWDHAFFNSMTM